MKMDGAIPTTLLAPCGMNCAVCYAYLRKKKPCMDAGEGRAASQIIAESAADVIAQTSEGLIFALSVHLFPAIRSSDSIKPTGRDIREAWSKMGFSSKPLAPGALY